MEIKDYLHLYIGCEVQVETASATFIGKLVGVYWDQWIVGVSPMELSFQVCLHGDTYHIYKASACKLILRKLSDMTLQEGAWCLKEVFFNHIDYPFTDFKLELVGEDQSNPSISINNDWYSHMLTFGNKTGSIWSFDIPSQNTKISPKIFTYLLKQGFDLFGLIPAGLAIDKTSLKN